MPSTSVINPPGFVVNFIVIHHRITRVVPTYVRGWSYAFLQESIPANSLLPTDDIK